MIEQHHVVVVVVVLLLLLLLILIIILILILGWFQPQGLYLVNVSLPHTKTRVVSASRFITRQCVSPPYQIPKWFQPHGL